MKFIDGQLVASGSLSRRSGTIDWIEWPSMRLTRTLRTGATSTTKPSSRVRTYTAEGMALEGRELYVLPEDGPGRVFHFKLDADGSQNASAAGVHRIPLQITRQIK